MAKTKDRKPKTIDLRARRPAKGPKVRATSLAATGTDPQLGRGIARSLAGGRATVDSPLLWSNVMPFWLPPQNADDQWRALDLDADALRVFAPHKLLELLVDLSPDVSRALFDFLNLSNPDWTLTAYNTGTLDVHPEAVIALGDFLDRLTARHGTPDVVFNRLFLNTWMRGAIFLELVLGKDGRTALEIACPDPQTARFIKRDDPEIGPIWVLGQLQGMGFVELGNRATVRYMPFHPLPGNPYGRSPASPALFSALFFLGVLHDVRRVVAQQGYPRIDIEIDFDAMKASMPFEDQDDPAKLKAWVDAAVAEVVKFYKSLQPDDAYVHSSAIKINPGGKAVGAVGADSLGGINGLITALERLLVRALKTMPLMMGMTDGVSEANANRQFEIHLLGIQAIQRLVEAGLEWCFTLALRALGIQADVAFEFSQNRAAEELRDAQVQQLRTTNAAANRDEGFWSQDEASQYAVGHNAVEQTPPKFARQDKAAEEKAKGVGLVPGSSTDDNNQKPKDGGKKTILALTPGPDGRVALLEREVGD